MELSSKNNEHTVGLICATGFLVLTLGIPFTGMLGGFYSQSVSMDFMGTPITQNNEYMWDGIEETAVFIFSMTVTVSYDTMEEGSQAGVLWNLLGLWGMIYLLSTLIGGGLVVFYAFSKMNGSTPKSYLNFGGVLLGLIGTIGEWTLMSLTLAVEDWEAMAAAMGALGGTVTSPSINLIMLASFIVGWILLIYGSRKAAQPAAFSPKKEPTVTDY
jgi:hypothetical protein